MPIRKTMRRSCGHAGVALDHGVLDFDGAAHGVDDAAELDNRAIASALDDSAIVHGDGRVDQVAAKRPQPRQCPVLVRAREPAESDDVSGEYRRDFSSLGHRAAPRQAFTTETGRVLPLFDYSD